jgi:hypothetical protein
MASISNVDLFSYILSSGQLFEKLPETLYDVEVYLHQEMRTFLGNESENHKGLIYV